MVNSFKGCGNIDILEHCLLTEYKEYGSQCPTVKSFYTPINSLVFR